jgi:tetratricopeptide (TPR) repeat protein
VGSPIVQLKPRLQPFEAAVDSYRQGLPLQCLDRLHGHNELPAVFLRARASLRAGCPNVGLDCLAQIDDGLLWSNRERAEVFTLRAALQTRLSDFDTARQTLDNGRVLALGSASASLEAEFHYYDALWSLGTDNFDEADKLARIALEVAPGFYDSDPYFVPLANSRARALQMRGLVAAAKERYEEQADFFRDAIEELKSASTADIWLTASSLTNLAFHVRDFDLVDDAAMLRREIERAKWPDELAPMKFEIRRALGWSSALRGDHLNAFREFRAMAQCADTPARKILASVDRSYLARELGETHSAQEELEYAAKLASSVEWKKVGQERIGLAQLAQEVAAFDPHHAGILFARYKELGGRRLAPNMLNNVDRRVQAFELLAEGTVLRANGSVPAAMQRFMRAYDIWDKLGYRWRAAMAALPLAEVLQEPRYVEHVKREAASRPNSWLARRAENLTCSNEPKYETDVRLRCL